MRWLAMSLILKASLCIAAPLCPDPNQREAKIGDEVITGYVMLHRKPLKLARVRVYSSLGNAAYVGTTDKDGQFVTGKLPPDDYYLEVDGWGSTTIHLNPKLDEEFRPQKPFWSLLLTEHSCVGEVMNMN